MLFEKILYRVGQVVVDLHWVDMVDIPHPPYLPHLAWAVGSLAERYDGTLKSKSTQTRSMITCPTLYSFDLESHRTYKHFRTSYALLSQQCCVSKSVKLTSIRSRH